MADYGRVLSIHRGTYSPSTTYEVLDEVLFNNSSWIAKQSTLNHEPPSDGSTSNTYWQLSAKGFVGDWENITDTPTTRDGYGITDVYTEAETNNLLNNKVSKGTLTISLSDYGAVGDGTADDTIPIKNAINAAYGKRLYINPGRYLISEDLVLTQRIYIYGCGNDSQITTNNTTANIFTVNAAGVTFYNFYIDSNVTKTAGCGIFHSEDTPLMLVNKVDMNKMYIGIKMSGVLDRCIDCYITNTIWDGILIDGGNDQIIDRTVVNGGDTPSGFASLDITATSCLMVSNSDFIRGYKACAIRPVDTTKLVGCAYFTNCYFDSSTISLHVFGDGHADRIKFTNCWFGSSTTGINISNTLADGIDFIGCDIMFNTNDGVFLNQCKDVGFDKCRISGNTGGSGINILTGAKRFQITNNVIGATGFYSGNAYGVYIASGTYDSYIITSNSFIRNTGGSLSDGGTATDGKIVANNLPA